MSGVTVIAFCSVLILFLLLIVLSSWYVQRLKKNFPEKWEKLGKPEPWHVFGERATVVSKEIWRSEGEMTGLKKLINVLTILYYLALLLLIIFIFTEK